MKNFTNNFKLFTSRLSARWLIMALMLLVGTSSAWANGFWGDNAWNIKFYSPDKNKEMWINDNYDSGHGASATIDLGTFTSAPYLKGYWAKTWGYGNDTSKYVKVTFNNTTTSSGVSKQWDSNGDQMWKSESLNIKFPDTEGSHEESITFAINGAETMTCKIKYNICASCCTNYYLQHPWNGGNWTWKELKKEDCNNNIYKLTAYYGNAGCDYSKPGVQEKQDYIANPTLEGNPVKGDECIFTFDANKKTITITKVVTCDDNPDFSVSLSESEVAVGCTGVTASIKGDDRPTVTWSSSDPKVATIGSDGAIIINAAGTTTITATTTEADGFCGGVEKKATLTVKSPSVKVSPNKNSLCEDETLTLTATLTNCGADNSIQWYKGEDLLTGETKDQLTISSVTTTNSGEYKAVVTGGIICSSIESSAVTITVNALPSAPSLSNPEAICEGTTFTLPEKDDSKKTITWNVNNRELTNLSVGPHTYTAKIVENGCESTTVDYIITVKEQLAKPDLAVTNVKQCGSNYTEGKIVISNHDPNNTYILKKGGNPINKEYNDGYSLSENEIGTYTVEVSKDNACGATSDAKIIEVTNNTPTVNSFAITKQPNVCMGNPVTLSYDDTEQSGDITYAWYEGVSDVVLGTESTLTIQQAKNASYKLVVTVTSNDCPASDEATTTVEPKAVPSAPTFDNDAMDACVDQQFTLPTPNNLKNGEEALWTVEGKLTTASQTIDEADEYRYIAYKNDGCPSEGTPFTVRVNPLPTINIGEDVTAVKFEDVVLTATGNNIADVTWIADKGTITKDATDPKKAVLTYDQAGAVTVTATATSAAGCESTVATKTVTFSAETCKPTTITVPANYIEIYCKYNDAPTQHDMKVDIWKKSEGQGTESYQSCSKSVDGYAYWKFNITDDATYCIRISNKELNYKSGSMCTLTRGHKYYFDIPGGWSGWTGGPDKSKTQDITETQDGPPAITTPAVKTVSATSEEGSGTVTFTGMIIKTGCAATSKIYYGYQFKKADEEWPTTGVEASNTPVEGKLIPLTNASETALYYQFSANVENLEDVDYHFRAYIINGYDFTNGNYDQGVYYGLDKLVTVSTVQTAVKTAEIELVNQDGTSVEPGHKYCVGETGYIKVTSDVKYTTIQWKTDKGTEIEETGNNGIYSFVAKGDDNIWVMLSNKHNDIDRPAINENPLVINTFADPILPRVSLNKVSICSNDAVGATVKLTNVVKGQTYQLYQQIENAGGSFTEQAIGEAKTQTEDVTDKTELVLHTLNNTYTTGKYFVKTYTSDCEENKVATQPFTFTVVDAAEVFISIDPASADTTPWMPAKFTVNASDAYTLNVTKGNPAEAATEAEVSQNGNKVSVKIPLPEGTQHVTGQYQNVTFPQGATTQYTITATLSATGGDNPCAAPTSATINLVPYVEECTIGH